MVGPIGRFSNFSGLSVSPFARARSSSMAHSLADLRAQALDA